MSNTWTIAGFQFSIRMSVQNNTQIYSAQCGDICVTARNQEELRKEIDIALEII